MTDRHALTAIPSPYILMLLDAAAKRAAAARTAKRPAEAGAADVAGARDSSAPGKIARHG